MVGRDVGVPEPERLLVDPELVRRRLEAAELRIESLEVADGTTAWWRLATHPMESFVRRIPDLVPTLRHRRALDLAQVLVVASEGEVKRFRHLLVDGEVEPVAPPPGPGDVAIALGDLERGFRWDGGLAVYGRRDLTAAPSPRRRRTGVAAFVSDLRDLRPGDLVVHMDHGIGRFTGFRRIEVEGRTLEMMVLAYRDDDTLLLPVERADLIHKYSVRRGRRGPGARPARRLDLAPPHAPGSRGRSARWRPRCCASPRPAVPAAATSSRRTRRGSASSRTPSPTT